MNSDHFVRNRIFIKRLDAAPSKDLSTVRAVNTHTGVEGDFKRGGSAKRTVILIYLIVTGILLTEAFIPHAEPLSPTPPKVPENVAQITTDTVTTVFTTTTRSTTTHTSTTSTSHTTTTTTYTLSTVTVETTTTTTSLTATYSTTSWDRIVLLTTATVTSESLFYETTSGTTTLIETSTIFSPTMSVPTTRVTSLNTTIYSPTVTLTSITSLRATTTVTSTLMTTATIYSPTVTTTSTSTTVTTILPVGERRCAIASAAYGSELAEPVQSLREFRDQRVRSTFAGQAFMRAFDSFYYSFSPTVASIMTSSGLLAALGRSLVYPLLCTLQLSSATFVVFSSAREIGVVVVGMLASALFGIVYLIPIMLGVCILKRKGTFNRKVAALLTATPREQEQT